jgi:hypothetical protein
MKLMVVSAALLLTAACGAYRFPGSPSAETGTVSGHVVAVPCAPVEKPGIACTGRSVAGLQVEFANGQATYSTVTDSAGNYAIQLNAGTWKVHMKTYMRVISGPPAVTVAAGSTVVANYVLDSGIRVPAPQPGG